MQSLDATPVTASTCESFRSPQTFNEGFSSLTEEEQHIRNLQRQTQRGRIELIMGPMFAGKSTELLRRVNRWEISGKKCLSVKYCADKRYSTNSISTHDQ